MKSFVKTTPTNSRRVQNPPVGILSSESTAKDQPKHAAATTDETIHNKWRDILDKAIEKESIPEALVARIDSMISK
jgi:hypothetical protein